jgi:hypothetical protein
VSDGVVVERVAVEKAMPPRSGAGAVSSYCSVTMKAAAASPGAVRPPA